MRSAVISDIHGNFEALEAVMKDIGGRGIDNIYCAGDVVGYGASPNECVEVVSSECKGSVAGNHDLAAVGSADYSRFRESARIALEWTAEKLEYSAKKWISRLPMELVFGDARMVHASPKAPESWEYVKSTLTLGAQFRSFNEKICFVGHSHVPATWTDAGEELTPDFGEEFSLEPDLRYIVNAGSVGQPRDRDPRACYVIYDDDAGLLLFRRVEYDVEASANKILEAGLPDYLASRLYIGF